MHGYERPSNSRYYLSKPQIHFTWGLGCDVVFGFKVHTAHSRVFGRLFPTSDCYQPLCREILTRRKTMKFNATSFTRLRLAAIHTAVIHHSFKKINNFWKIILIMYCNLYENNTILMHNNTYPSRNPTAPPWRRRAGVSGTTLPDMPYTLHSVSRVSGYKKMNFPEGITEILKDTYQTSIEYIS